MGSIKLGSLKSPNMETQHVGSLLLVVRNWICVISSLISGGQVVSVWFSRRSVKVESNPGHSSIIWVEWFSTGNVRPASIPRISKWMDHIPLWRLCILDIWSFISICQKHSTLPYPYFTIEIEFFIPDVRPCDFRAQGGFAVCSQCWRFLRCSTRKKEADICLRGTVIYILDLAQEMFRIV